MHLLLLLAGLVLGAGCNDEAALDGPRIERVSPEAVAPGQRITFEGEGFGAALGTVAVGGRALAVVTWSAGTIVATVPPNMAAGATFAVVKAGGRPSPPAAVTVLGDQRRADAGRRFPHPLDAGLRPDAAPPVDLGPPEIDSAPPPMNLAVTFAPDPPRGDAVQLEALPSAPDQLVLQVRIPRSLVPQTLGLALHLAYDSNLLRFESAQPDERDRPVRAPTPGRLVLAVLEPRQAEVLTLTFSVVGRGEGRIEIPQRHRTLRDLRNAPLDVTWAGGSVRVREVQP